MKIQQRDIVELNFELPEGRFKAHPALIISNENVLFPHLTTQPKTYKTRKVSKIFLVCGHISNLLPHHFKVQTQLFFTLNFK
ncbi:MAG: hypothetical protein ABI172_04540 [Ginsengibacter sp.]